MSEAKEADRGSEPDLNRALMTAAVALHRAGRLPEAQKIYDAVRGAGQSNAQLLALLGTLHAQRNDFAAAIDLLNASIELDDKQASTRNAMGKIYHQQRRYDDALAEYAIAERIQADYAETYKNRGVTLAKLGRFTEAMESYAAAIRLDSKDAGAHDHRATLLRALGRYSEALADCDAAIALKPGWATAHAHRGRSLEGLNRLEAAVESFDRALALDPRHLEALKGRGTVLRRLNRPAEALACFDKAIALKPDNAGAHYNRHLVLRNLKRHAEALLSLETAQQLDPGIPYARGESLFIRMRISDWDGFDQSRAELMDGLREGRQAVTPFPLLLMSGDAALQQKCAEIYSREEFPSAGMSGVAPFVAPRRKAEKLRVAYISANFGRHPMTQLITAAIEAHDRSRFETIGVSLLGDDGSEMRARLENAFDDFIDVSRLGDTEVVGLLRQRRIDIAVDLMGFTKHARPRIFAMRVAPVQVNYIGFPGTLGSPWIDHVIADRFVVPEDLQRFYTEKVVRLPDIYLPADPGWPVAERTPSRAELGLPADGFVFCCFNGNQKITPDVFDVWMRLLHAVPRSVLWLLRPSEVAAANLRREAELCDVDSSRVIFAPFAPHPEHLARHRLADLFLDTTPYGAHTTACDALFAGLPLLTCMGESFASRVSGSLLHAVGLPELITESLAEYEARALDLVRDRAMLAELRERLARNKQTSPLFDTRRFTRNLEAAFTDMWSRRPGA